MIVLILINIFIIIYIYFKYYKFPENIKNENEQIEDKDSIIIGYIHDNGFNNNFDLILSEIVNLNIKGYITIEYGKENIDKYNYIIKQNIDIHSEKLKKYELLIMSFLFSRKTEITKIELEEKLKNTFGSYNIQFNEIEKVINNQLIEENIIDKEKQEELSEKSKKYIKISIILTIVLGIINLFSNSESLIIYMLIYILEKSFSSVLLLKANSYTIKGQILKYNIDSYKIKIENKEFLINKNTMQEIVQQKDFANSLALHIKTYAKQVFVENEVLKNATKISNQIVKKLFFASVIILLVAILVAKIVTVISPGAVVWLYIIVTIIAACIADITLSRKK